MTNPPSPVHPLPHRLKALASWLWIEGYTTRQIAEALGVDWPTISRWSRFNRAHFPHRPKEFHQMLRSLPRRRSGQ